MVCKMNLEGFKHELEREQWNKSRNYIKFIGIPIANWNRLHHRKIGAISFIIETQTKNKLRMR